MPRLFGDLALPPTLVLDFLFLGWPMNIVVGLCLLLAVVGLFLMLRRKKLHTGINIIVCLLLFAGANFGIYVLQRSRAVDARRERERERQRQSLPPAPDKQEPFDIEKPPKI